MLVVYWYANIQGNLRIKIWEVIEGFGIVVNLNNGQSNENSSVVNPCHKAYSCHNCGLDLFNVLFN